MQNDTPQTTLVLGGGPAGLTAGYLLGKSGREVVVFEAEDQVGGLAKTVEIDGYRFDLGGHRFFTEVTEVDDLWHEILGDEFLRRPRMSRIYWNNRYLDYPLRGGDVIRKLGPVELARCMASYLRAAAKRGKVDESLEDWVTNRFGKRLYQLFFKSYNEKVWGVPPSEIRAEWAAQRINGLSFFSGATARSCSRTTGSRSTGRGSASAASRTTGRGPRGWSPIRTRRASVSSTSALRATTSGRWTTPVWSRSRPRSSRSWGSRRRTRSS